MKHYLMKCGHIANAKVAATGDPVCIICDCLEVDKEIDEIEDREARCTECGRRTKSKVDLPFFKYCPDKEYDDYYCGCYGWD